jgi:hypothetical protein
MFDAEQLARACEGVPFPARRWQLTVWAEWNCASSELCEALHHLPDELYTSTGQLVELFEAVRRRAALAGENARPPAPAVGR